MPISLTNVGTASNSTGATVAVTAVSGAPAGNVVIVILVENASTSNHGSISDSAGNTYPLVTATGLISSNSGNYNGQVFYGVINSAIAAGGTITYTRQLSNSPVAMDVFYASGLLTSGPLDSGTVRAAITAGASGGGALPAITSGAPSVPNELFVAVDFWEGNPINFTQAGGWSSNPPTFVGVGLSGTAVAVGPGALINTGTGAVSYQPSSSNGWFNNTGQIIAGFKPANPVPYKPTLIYLRR